MGRRDGDVHQAKASDLPAELQTEPVHEALTDPLSQDPRRADPGAGRSEPTGSGSNPRRPAQGRGLAEAHREPVKGREATRRPDGQL
jgi:hypothetical protein